MFGIVVVVVVEAEVCWLLERARFSESRPTLIRSDLQVEVGRHKRRGLYFEQR